MKQVKVGDLYNPLWKEDFLNEFDVSDYTATIMRYSFKAAAEYEEEIGKDLSLFNLTEMKGLFLALRRKTLNSLEQSISTFYNYTNHVMNKKLRGQYENGINQYDIGRRLFDLNDFISVRRTNESYIPKDDLYESILPVIKNPVDKALIVLIYHQVLGKESTEVRTLRKDKVDFDNNQITVTDLDGISRTVRLDEEVMSILYEAVHQDFYMVKNGQPVFGGVEENSNVELLANTSYVIRKVMIGSEIDYCEDEPITTTLIYNRFFQLNKYVDKDFRLNTTNLYNSGILYEIEKRIGMNKKIGISDKSTKQLFEEISEYYQVDIPYGRMRSLISKYNTIVESINHI